MNCVSDAVTLFISEYNKYARLNKIKVITSHELLESIKSYDVPNVIDKIEILYPTAKKYIIDNKYKIYCNGKQYIIDKDNVCHICNNNFCYSNAVAQQGLTFVHNNCQQNRHRELIKKSMILVLLDNNLCRLCEKKCDEKEHVIMSKGNFCHKSCYLERIKNLYVDYTCFVCNKLLYKYGSVISYCVKDDKNVHPSCMPKGVKCKKVRIDMRISRCGLCQFYVNDKKCMHDVCENMLKEIQK